MSGRKIGALIVIIASIYFMYENRRQLVTTLINRQFLWKIVISIVMQIPAIRHNLFRSVMDTRSNEPSQ